MGVLKKTDFDVYLSATVTGLASKSDLIIVNDNKSSNKAKGIKLQNELNEHICSNIKIINKETIGISQVLTKGLGKALVNRYSFWYLSIFVCLFIARCIIVYHVMNKFV